MLDKKDEISAVAVDKETDLLAILQKSVKGQGKIGETIGSFQLDKASIGGRTQAMTDRIYDSSTRDFCVQLFQEALGQLFADSVGGPSLSTHGPSAGKGKSTQDYSRIYISGDPEFIKYLLSVCERFKGPKSTATSEYKVKSISEEAIQKIVTENKLTFTSPEKKSGNKLVPLGIELWSEKSYDLSEAKKLKSKMETEFAGTGLGFHLVKIPASGFFSSDQYKVAAIGSVDALQALQKKSPIRSASASSTTTTTTTTTTATTTISSSMDTTTTASVSPVAVTTDQGESGLTKSFSFFVSPSFLGKPTQEGFHKESGQEMQDLSKMKPGG